MAKNSQAGYVRTLGEAVRELREEKRWNQSELARRASRPWRKVHPQNIQQLEAGTVAHPRYLETLAQALGKTIDELYAFRRLTDGARTKRQNGSGDEITRDDRALIDAALAARECAHAPWSRFKVGAAALFGNRIVHGCNVEFDVYGLTNCAERTAVFAAHACGAARNPLTAIAVVADTPQPVSPCGACRQVLFETGGANLRVILANTNGDARIVRMADLLPGCFQLDPEAPVRTARERRSTAKPRKRRGTGTGAK